MKFSYMGSLLGGLLLWGSCETPFIEKEVSNDPISNFDLLWNEFDAYYALFEYKEVDWDQVYALNRPLVTLSTSTEELFEICSAMIEKLDDRHTFLYAPEDGLFYNSGAAKRAYAEEEFSLALVLSNYLEADYQRWKDSAITYGMIKGANLGYIHLADMEGGHGQDFGLLTAYFKDTDGMVIDVRGNGGGNDEYAHEVAQFFSDGKHLAYTVQTKNGPEHSDFDHPTEWYTRDQKEEAFLKPIVLLTDRQTISGGEIFCFLMKTYDHVYHIGDHTAGAQSDLSPIRNLPNGWMYGFSYQKYLDPQGKNWEGVGIEPDTHLRNSQQDLTNGVDRVLAWGISQLK